MIVATFQKSEKIGLIKICKKYKKSTNRLYIKRIIKKLKSGFFP